MSFLKNVFGKGKQPDPGSRDAAGHEASDSQIGAIAVVSDMFIIFDSEETIRNWVTQLIHAKWPGAKLPPQKQIEVQTGFRGESGEAESTLREMLKQIMSRARLDPGRYQTAVYTLRSDVHSSTTWCAVAVRSLQPAASGSGDTADFIGTFKNHLQRVRDALPQIQSFLDEYFDEDAILQIASNAATKMNLTKSDGKQHSTIFGKDVVIYHISTVAVDLNHGRDYFSYATGGYTKLLEKAWASYLHQAPNVSVWCHIVYGTSAAGNWVQLAICPLKKSAPIETTLMPVDLLTNEERKKLGM